MRPKKQKKRVATKTVPAGNSGPLVLTPEEAARLAGVRRKWIYAAIGRGQLPGVCRLGPRLIRIHKATFVEWLSAGATS